MCWRRTGCTASLRGARACPAEAWNARRRTLRRGTSVGDDEDLWRRLAFEQRSQPDIRRQVPADHTALDAEAVLECFVAIGRKHGKNTTVGANELRKRVLVEPTFDVPAKVIDHARQRNVE